MRFDDERVSDNVESQRGMDLGGGFGAGGGGFGPLLFGLIASRFGIGGIVVLVIIGLFVGGNPLGLMGGNPGSGSAPQVQQQSSASVCASDATTHFACQVLASTEDDWTRLLAPRGIRYTDPKLVVYDRNGQSGCGAAQTAMGPFYCPNDQRIYLDTAFFAELAQRFQAPGDFAQAYVIAHEVGHHVQDLLGTLGRATQEQHGVSEAQANAIQVRIELQADCYAGVWAAQERTRMDAGDLQEGMRAAAAVGDDTLQQASQGRVVPETFTHGTSAQRQQALTTGYNGGTIDSCASYTAQL